MVVKESSRVKLSKELYSPSFKQRYSEQRVVVKQSSIVKVSKVVVSQSSRVKVSKEL